MPEASMDEYDPLPSRKDQIWLTRKVAPVEAEAITQPVDKPADD